MAFFNTLLTAVDYAGKDLNSLQVILLGVGIVFVGLIAIVFLSILMSAVVRAIEKNKKPATVKTATPAAPAPIANRGEFIAAVSVAIAEELGTDVSAIRIVSVKPM